MYKKKLQNKQTQIPSRLPLSQIRTDKLVCHVARSDCVCSRMKQKSQSITNQFNCQETNRACGTSDCTCKTHTKTHAQTTVDWLSIRQMGTEMQCEVEVTHTRTAMKQKDCRLPIRPNVNKQLTSTVAEAAYCMYVYTDNNKYLTMTVDYQSSQTGSNMDCGGSDCTRTRTTVNTYTQHRCGVWVCGCGWSTL